MEHANDLTTRENSFRVPRCKECNKLFKKAEANEYELCPACLSKLTELGELIKKETSDDFAIIKIDH